MELSEIEFREGPLNGGELLNLFTYQEQGITTEKGLRALFELMASRSNTGVEWWLRQDVNAEALLLAVQRMIAALNDDETPDEVLSDEDAAQAIDAAFDLFGEQG